VLRFANEPLYQDPMHPSFQRAMDLTKILINAAIEVHRDKGPGLVESIYEWCLEKELQLRDLSFVSQKAVLIHYKGFTREESLRFDIEANEGSIGCPMAAESKRNPSLPSLPSVRKSSVRKINFCPSMIRDSF
jgi:hypothetical protein